MELAHDNCMSGHLGKENIDEDLVSLLVLCVREWLSQIRLFIQSLSNLFLYWMNLSGKFK